MERHWESLLIGHQNAILKLQEERGLNTVGVVLKASVVGKKRPYGKATKRTKKKRTLEKNLK
jgi:hypothetical protein